MDETAIADRWFGKNPNSRLPPQMNAKLNGKWIFAITITLTPGLAGVPLFSGKNDDAVPDEDLLDDEDYDMGDLMANRAEEERIEPRSWFQQKEHSSLNFIANLSLSDCASTKFWLNSEFRRLSAVCDYAEHISPQVKQGMEMERIRELDQTVKQQRDNDNRTRLLQTILPRVRTLTFDKQRVADNIEELWGCQWDWNFTKAFPKITHRFFKLSQHKFYTKFKCLLSSFSSYLCDHVICLSVWFLYYLNG